MLFSWDNSLFRLGHGFNSELQQITRGYHLVSSDVQTRRDLGVPLSRSKGTLGLVERFFTVGTLFFFLNGKKKKVWLQQGFGLV